MSGMNAGQYLARCQQRFRRLSFARQARRRLALFCLMGAEAVPGLQL
jgi:hypothetical protein